jgi:hypothetical protein
MDGDPTTDFRVALEKRFSAVSLEQQRVRGDLVALTDRMTDQGRRTAILEESRSVDSQALLDAVREGFAAQAKTGTHEGPPNENAKVRTAALVAGSGMSGAGLLEIVKLFLN